MGLKVVTRTASAVKNRYSIDFYLKNTCSLPKGNAREEKQTRGSLLQIRLVFFVFEGIKIQKVFPLNSGNFLKSTTNIYVKLKFSKCYCNPCKKNYFFYIEKD
jgi:hypothetical protein